MWVKESEGDEQLQLQEPVWWQTVLTTSFVAMEGDVEQLTLLSVDGNGQESDEGYDCQQREENPDGEEELEALQPRPPVVLQVHDVSDQGPKSQHA